MKSSNTRCACGILQPVQTETHRSPSITISRFWSFALIALLTLVLPSPPAWAAAGDKLWGFTIAGTANDTDKAHGIAVDSARNVIVAGTPINTNTSEEFTVVKLSPGTGTPIWRKAITGSNASDEANAVTVDSADNVIAAGSLSGTDGSNPLFTVVKFDGATGNEIWRYQLSGSAGGAFALAVTVDANNDVIAVGYALNTSNNGDFTVVKISHADGSEMWRREINGPVGGEDEAHTVAVDFNGDVIAGGFVSNSIVNNGFTTDFYVVKLKGTTDMTNHGGDILWTQTVLGSSNDPVGQVTSIATDSDGNVIAGGRTTNSNDNEDFVVVKIQGITNMTHSGGEVLWNKVFSGSGGNGFVHDQCNGVALDALGDIAATGVLDTSANGTNFVVMKLASADGTQRWQTFVENNGQSGVGNAVRVDAANNVISAGQTSESSTAEFAVGKLNGSDGSMLWLTELNNGGNSQALALAIDSQGDPSAAGFISSASDQGDFFAAKFAGGATPSGPGRYLCDTAKVPKSSGFTPLSVTLQDVFETATFSVTKPFDLCPAANVNAQGIADSLALEAFTISNKTKPVKHTHIGVTNEFGSITVDTEKPTQLLVPTAVSQSGAVNPPDLKAHNVDHYKCYSAKITKGTPKFVPVQGVKVEALFTSPPKTITLTAPAMLCTPVNKNSEGIKNPVVYQMCYHAAFATGQTKPKPVSGIFLNNQFGPEQLGVTTDNALCVPSALTM